MEEWKEYKLGDLYDVHNGLSKGGKFFGSGYPFLSFKTVFNNYFLPSVLPDLVQSDKKEQSGYDIKRGDVFVTRTSETPEELGMSSVALKDYPLATYNGFTKRLRPKDTSIIYPEFIGYYLRSTKFRELFYGLASSMSTRASLANGDLLGMRVFLPTFATQEKIAKILKSLDDKIEVNRRINDNFVIEPLLEILLIWMMTTLINDNLEQQAQALFKSWFVDFEPFRDQPFKESELGMIPNGWHAAVLDELCSFISRGLTPKYDDNSDELILGQTCVRNNIVTLDNARKHKPKQRTEKWVQQWDTLINSTGVGSLGRVGIVYFDMDNVAIDSHITVIRPKSALVRHYVGRNLLSRQLEIENMAVGSTGQTELPKERVKSLPIMMPDDNALIRFNAIIEPIAYQLYRNIEESRRLALLRDALLPRLMSGELTIDDL